MWNWPNLARAAVPGDVAPFVPTIPTGDLRAAFAALPGDHVGEVAVRPLIDNVEAWTERWRLLAGAEQRLDVGYFILTEDVFGMAMLGHLLHKAEQGVRVRLLLDAMGRTMGRDIDRDDCVPALVGLAGLEVRAYRPMRARLLDALRELNPLAALASNHDKIFVADDAVGLIGGRNIGARYFAHAADLPEAFHDIDLTLEGVAAVAALVGAFERIHLDGQTEVVDAADDGLRQRCLVEMRRAYRAMDSWLQPGRASDAIPVARSADDRWHQELSELPRLRGALGRPRPAASNGSVVILNSLPRRRPQLDPITASLLMMLQAASRQVLVASPYLVLTEDMAQALAASGERGIDIVTVTNSPVSTDNPFSGELFLDVWPELLAKVPNMRLFAGGTERNLHGKLTVFDGAVALVGAYNLDPISLTINGEIAAAIWSEELAARFAEQPYALLRQGPPLIYEYLIERDARGRPLRDDDGEVLVAFGPADHSDPEQWQRPNLMWRLLRLAAYLPAGPNVFAVP
ncbi:MAG: phospholipase D-like domain-containing protein [Pseudomonadales bacterium]